MIKPSLGTTVRELAAAVRSTPLLAVKLAGPASGFILKVID
jgi:hypothetical protein